MARVLNNKQHDIVLSAVQGDGGIARHVIPGATAHELAAGQLVPGVNEDVPDEFIAAAVKDNKAAAAYFSEGYLVIDGGKAPKAK